MGAYSTIVEMCHVCVCVRAYVCLFLFLVSVTILVHGWRLIIRCLWPPWDFRWWHGADCVRGSPENEWAEVARPSFYFVLFWFWLGIIRIYCIRADSRHAIRSGRDPRLIDATRTISNDVTKRQRRYPHSAVTTVPTPICQQHIWTGQMSESSAVYPGIMRESARLATRCAIWSAILVVQPK